AVDRQSGWRAHLRAPGPGAMAGETIAAQIPSHLSGPWERQAGPRPLRPDAGDHAAARARIAQIAVTVEIGALGAPGSPRCASADLEEDEVRRFRTHVDEEVLK